MVKVLKLFLFLYVLATFIPLTKSGITFALLLSIFLNLIIAFLAWEGFNLILRYPEDIDKNKKIKLVSWLLLLFFSIPILGIGMLPGFFLRFYTDNIYINSAEAGNIASVSFLRSPIYTEITGLILPGLVSLPLFYLAAKTLKFKRPISQAILVFLLWEFVWHIPKLLDNLSKFTNIKV